MGNWEKILLRLYHERLAVAFRRSSDELMFASEMAMLRVCVAKAYITSRIVPSPLVRSLSGVNPQTRQYITDPDPRRPDWSEKRCRLKNTPEVFIWVQLQLQSQAG